MPDGARYGAPAECVMRKCYHAHQHADADGPFVCVDCGQIMPDIDRMDWSNGHPPMIAPDLKPHFSTSAGKHITSRAQRAEMMKREGLRIQEENPEQRIKEAEAANRDRIKHPEKYGKESLGEFLYNTFQGPTGPDRKGGATEKEFNAAREEARNPLPPEIIKRERQIV